MYTTPEQLSAAHKANVEMALTLANTAFASIERFAALNLNTARSILEDSVANAKALMSAKGPQELVAIQSSLAQPALNKAIAYSRNLYEIATQSHDQFGGMIEAQFATMNTNINSALDKATKNAPAGADVAIASVRSAIAAANNAYGTINKAAQQVVQMAEANMAAATNATVNAVSAAQNLRKVA
ncbi:MAG: phasin family protein [Sterolibacteriaceae bacterium MAG5]|nr:phasin family protein [Candidatus Nitricoxidireducens bremensis]